MTTKMQKSLVALAVGATFAASGAVMAATLTWDSSASSPTAPVDGAGTWSAASGAYANWSNGTTDSVWSNSADSSYIASFGSYVAGNGNDAGTVKLGSNITAGGLVANAAYNSTTYTIAGSGSYGLTLTGPSVAVNASLTLSANTTFQQGLNLTGGSGNQLAISGTNTNSVGTTISGSNVMLAMVNLNSLNNANFGAPLGTGQVTVNTTSTFGGILNISGGDSTGTLANPISISGVGAGSGALLLQGANITFNLTGPMTVVNGGVANDAQIMVNGTTGVTANLNGVIGGNGNFTINGQGGGTASKQTINFNAAETYTGGTTLYSYAASTLMTLNGGVNTLPVGTTLNLAPSIWNGNQSPLTLDLHGNNQDVAMLNVLSITGGTGGSIVNIEDTTNSGATLTMTGTGPGTSKPGTVAAYANIASGGTLNLLTNFTDSSPNDGVAVYNGTTVNLASGVTFSVPLNLYLAANNTNGTVNLNGGTLISNAISTAGTGVATINLDGTLATTENSPVTGNTWIFPNITLNVLSQGVTLNVASGVQSVVYSPFLQGPSNSTGGVTVTGGGTVIMDGGNNTYVGATNIAAGTTLTLAAPTSTTSGGTTSTTPGGTITGTSALTIASGGTLNLANTDAGNKVIIDYGSGSSPNSAIQAYVASGAITTASGYAVGYADGADGVVSGLSAGQEEIMATLPGDTNLAGTVNLGDVSTVYNNVGITSGATWDQGDFTASGAVTLGDLTSTYNNVGLSLASGPVSAGTASTAQPMAAVMARTLVAASTNTSTTPSVSDVTLTVNKATGDAMLVFANPSAQFYAWEITSTTGGLNYANLTDIPNFGTGLHARGPTALDGVYSGFATGGYDNPGGTWNLGDIITPGDITSGALDFSFNEFNPSTGLSVTFDPGTINYTAVPEPATLGLLALGGCLAMLSPKRKRRRA